MTGFYDIEIKDLNTAKECIVSAFDGDPLWSAFFKDIPESEKKIPYFFEIPLRQCGFYGGAVSVDEKIESVMCWLPGEKADSTIWRMFRSGCISPTLKLGPEIGRKASEVFKGLEKSRKKLMAGNDYLYLYLLGVRKDMQGKGHGRQLLAGLMEKAASENRDIYLETETERNVGYYEGFGFKVAEKTDLPVLGIPFWKMVKKN